MAWLKPWPPLTLVLLYILDFIHGCYQLPLFSDTCDHTIWDNTRQTRGVHNVIAACNEGVVDWRHPYGAISITFQPAGYTAGPLTVCFRARTTLTVAKISMENDDGVASSSTVELSGDNRDKLTPLVTLNRTHTHMRLERCVRGARPITFYVEADADLNSTTAGQVLLEYDVDTAATKSQDPLEDCRPCSEPELFHAVCSSDVVASGQMESVLQNLNGGLTEIRVKATEVIRQSQDIFQPPLKESHFSKLPTEHIQTMSRGQMLRGQSQLWGSIHVPGKCRAHRGDGDFLFVARIRLGHAVLRCAPRLQDFWRSWKQAEAEGRNPCILS